MRVEAARLLFVVTEDWYFALHWRALAKAAQDAGFRVAVATRVREQADCIVASGLELLPLRRLRRASLNPLTELAAIAELAGVIRRWTPSIVHLVALKPIVYGAMALRLVRGPRCVNAIAGLGFVFLEDQGLARLLRPIVKPLLRNAMWRADALTTVQNPDDSALLVRERLAPPDRIRLIRGAGIDLRRFTPSALPAGQPLVLLMSRMLWDKGIGEFVAAARQLRQGGFDARFVLVGEPDEENPGTVPRSQLQQWNDEGVVEWWGFRADAAAVLAQARLVVLPSYYREGLPTVLTEAGACGRPAITTDTPGCREVVRDGINGLLVPPRDVAKLAAAIAALLGDEARCRAMGEQARLIVEREFSIDAVVGRTLEVYGELLAAPALAT